MLEVVLGGGDAFRPKIVIDADEFIGVKSFKAKGKRVTNYEIDTINLLPPREVPEEDAETEIEALDEQPDEAPRSNSDIFDELTGQRHLFDPDDINQDEE